MVDVTSRSGYVDLAVRDVKGRRIDRVHKGQPMFSDFMKDSLRSQVTEQLTEARRQLRDQEKRLAQLTYEWNIAKRLRHQASSEDEREKWRVQSDAYMGQVLQQEGVIQEIQDSIDRHRSRLEDLNSGTPD